MIWSDAAVQRLEQLRAEGLTWADVARRLTREFGHPCSRQAVEGKWSRIRKAAGKPKHARLDWWDQENRTQRLIELWNATNGAAMTAGQIAKQLGTTRNPVLGKVHRLRQAGVHMVAKTNGHNGTTCKSRKRKRTREQNSADGGHAIRAAKARAQFLKDLKQKPPEPLPTAPPAPVGGVLFIEAKLGQCRWPLWDSMSDPRHVCGAEALFDKPYCDEHAKRAQSQHQPEAKTKPARWQR